MISNEDKILIENYLTGELSENEVNILERRLQSDKEIYDYLLAEYTVYQGIQSYLQTQKEISNTNTDEPINLKKYILIILLILLTLVSVWGLLFLLSNKNKRNSIELIEQSIDSTLTSGKDTTTIKEIKPNDSVKTDIPKQKVIQDEIIKKQSPKTKKTPKDITPNIKQPVDTTQTDDLIFALNCMRPDCGTTARIKRDDIVINEKLEGNTSRGRIVKTSNYIFTINHIDRNFVAEQVILDFVWQNLDTNSRTLQFVFYNAKSPILSKVLPDNKQKATFKGQLMKGLYYWEVKDANNMTLIRGRFSTN